MEPLCLRAGSFVGWQVESALCIGIWACIETAVRVGSPLLYVRGKSLLS